VSELRARIVAALRAADRRAAGFIGYDELADAVIAELHDPSKEPATTVPEPLGERVFRDLRIDLEARRVTVAGHEVVLTKTEFDLLDAITSRPRAVHTRKMLRERVWGPNWFGADHVVDVHVNNLRKKINKESSSNLIETVRGVGFRLAD
jgi:DNA-binding response OmpR family regulator